MMMLSATDPFPIWFSHQWVWFAAIPSAGLILLYPCLVIRKYIRIIVNIMDDIAPLPEYGGNENVQLKGEEVSFLAADGQLLQGVIVGGKPGQTKRGMVVFAPEFSNTRASCLRYCRPLLQAGYDVFAFDFRGHGASAPEEGYRPRPWPSDRERADMIGAIAFICSYLEQHGRSRNVGLFGISRGAGAAILAAVGIDSVRAVVTDGAFSSDTTLEYLMKRFATIFARIRIVAENHPPTVWRFLRWLLFRECNQKFHCRFPSVRKAMVRMGPKPILLIHGEKDSYIPISQSQSLYQLAGGPKELWIVPEARHNQSILVQPQRYAQRLVRFFDEHLVQRHEAVATQPAYGEGAKCRMTVPAYTAVHARAVEGVSASS